MFAVCRTSLPSIMTRSVFRHVLPHVTDLDKRSSDLTVYTFDSITYVPHNELGINLIRLRI